MKRALSLAAALSLVLTGSAAAHHPKPKHYKPKPPPVVVPPVVTPPVPTPAAEGPRVLFCEGPNSISHPGKAHDLIWGQHVAAEYLPLQLVLANVGLPGNDVAVWCSG